MINSITTFIYLALVPSLFWGTLSGLLIDKTLGVVVFLVFFLAGVDVLLRPSQKGQELVDAIQRSGS